MTPPHDFTKRHVEVDEMDDLWRDFQIPRRLLDRLLLQQAEASGNA